jgi:hypothetical protein
LPKNEDEYNSNPSLRIKREAVLIYEEKSIEEMLSRLKTIENKLDKIKSMITAHDYETKRLMKK